MIVGFDEPRVWVLCPACWRLSTRPVAYYFGPGCFACDVTVIVLGSQEVVDSAMALGGPEAADAVLYALAAAHYASIGDG